MILINSKNQWSPNRAPFFVPKNNLKKTLVWFIIFLDVCVYRKGIFPMEENKIKAFEKKIRILFIIRICLWLVCAFGFAYWIYWSFESYNYINETDYHEYATFFRPYFRTGIIISVVSITVSLVLRLVSDATKREMKDEMYKVH